MHPCLGLLPHLLTALRSTLNHRRNIAFAVTITISRLQHLLLALVVFLLLSSLLIPLDPLLRGPGLLTQSSFVPDVSFLVLTSSVGFAIISFQLLLFTKFSGLLSPCLNVKLMNVLVERIYILSPKPHGVTVETLRHSDSLSHYYLLFDLWEHKV